jgi:hypothetical protein
LCRLPGRSTAHRHRNGTTTRRRWAIEEERKVAFVALGAVPAGFLVERLELIGEYEAGLIKKPANQGRFAVVDRTADDESKQALRLFRWQKRAGIERRRVGLDIHQK